MKNGSLMDAKQNPPQERRNNISFNTSDPDSKLIFTHFPVD
jgi:hypothetical protein